MSDAGLLDSATLEMMSERFGADMVKAMVGQFTSESEARIPAIEAALAAGDLATLQKQAHDLTTSAGTLGVTGLAEQTRLAEQACKSGDVPAALAACQPLPGLLRQALDEISARFG